MWRNCWLSIVLTSTENGPWANSVTSKPRATETSARQVANCDLIGFGGLAPVGACLSNFALADVIVTFTNKVRALRTRDPSSWTSLADACNSHSGDSGLSSMAVMLRIWIAKNCGGKMISNFFRYQVQRKGYVVPEQKW